MLNAKSILSLSIFIIFKLIYTVSTFSRTRHTGITNIGVSEKGENLNTQYYTVSGVQTNGKTKGVYIQKSTDNTGKVIIKKVIKR